MTDSPIYLNHAGTSWPKPECVQQAVMDAMQSPPEAWADQFNAAHKALADYFHLPTTDQLLLTPGCTSSLATAIADVPLQSGDRILTSSLEHHALHRPLLKWQERGCPITYVPRTSNEPFDLEFLEKELKAGGVKLIAVCGACNVTGESLPYREIIALAKEYAAMTLIDGAQLVGWHEIDLSTLGADLFAFGGHKGLHAPWGIGGLFVSSETTLNTPAAACSISSETGQASCQTMPGYCDVGSVDQIALAGLAAAIGWLQSSTNSDRWERSLQQVDLLRQSLTEIAHLEFVGDTTRQTKLPTIAFHSNRDSVQELDGRMRQANVIGSAGLQCSPLTHETLATAPDGVIRLSVGMLTSLAEVREVAKRLPRMLQ